MVVWRYLRDGRVRHALDDSFCRTACCGVRPAWHSDWLGTGNQTEYDTCEKLSACKRCVKIGGISPEYSKGS
jgi:hypothetical protein